MFLFMDFSGAFRNMLTFAVVVLLGHEGDGKEEW